MYLDFSNKLDKLTIPNAGNFKKAIKIVQQNT